MIATETFGFSDLEGEVMFFPDKKVSVAIILSMYVNSLGMFYNPIVAKNEFSKNISNSHMKFVSDNHRADLC